MSVESARLFDFALDATGVITEVQIYRVRLPFENPYDDNYTLARTADIWCKTLTLF